MIPAKVVKKLPDFLLRCRVQNSKIIKVSTQWDPISFTVKFKITFDEILIHN